MRWVTPNAEQQTVTTTMSTFTAYRLHAGQPQPAGSFDSVTIEDPGAEDALIRVAFSSVNFKDALAAAGRNSIIRAWPRIGGIDFTGTVEAGARFAPGTPVVVHGFGIGVDHDGGYAQFARVPADWVLPLPAGLSLIDAATLGVAGYTAALAIDAMELNGLAPDAGPIAVTGATGGVASVAIDILAARGYRVTAVSGKSAEADYLRQLGATAVLPREALAAGGKPLEKGVWAGAVDSVGGSTLAALLRSMQLNGVVAAFGNAGGPELATTVLPFILRGVRLIGINGNSPMPLRARIWRRLATDLRPRHLELIRHEITFAELPGALATVGDGGARGRFVVRMP